MPDLTRAVTYRGLNINSAQVAVGKTGASGIITETADISDIPLAEFSERVRVHDGYNVLEPYRANWVIHLSGSIFAPTRGQLFDALQNLRRVMSPDTALRDSPSTKGFLPFAYMEPHDPPSGLVTKTLQCRPMGLQWKADEGTAAKISGREDYTALALRWTVDLLVYQGPILTLPFPPDNPDNPIDWPPGGGGEEPPPPPIQCVGNGVGPGFGNGVTYNYTSSRFETGLGPAIPRPREGSLDIEYIYGPSTDFLQYWSTFSNDSTEYPTAGQIYNGGNGGVNCCIFTTGGVDYGGTGGASGFVRFTTVGPGTLTARTAVHPGGTCGDHTCGQGVGIAGTMTSYIPGSFEVVASASGVLATNMVVHIPAQHTFGGGPTVNLCAVYTDLHFPGGNWGFVSASWAAE